MCLLRIWMELSRCRGGGERVKMHFHLFCVDSTLDLADGRAWCLGVLPRVIPTSSWFGLFLCLYCTLERSASLRIYSLG